MTLVSRTRVTTLMAPENEMDGERKTMDTCQRLTHKFGGHATDEDFFRQSIPLPAELFDPGGHDACEDSIVKIWLHAEPLDVYEKGRTRIRLTKDDFPAGLVVLAEADTTPLYGHEDSTTRIAVPSAP